MTTMDIYQLFEQSTPRDPYGEYPQAKSDEIWIFYSFIILIKSCQGPEEIQCAVFVTYDALCV